MAVGSKRITQKWDRKLCAMACGYVVDRALCEPVLAIGVAKSLLAVGMTNCHYWEATSNAKT